MSKYHATVSWTFQGESFLKGTYSRGHEWQFDGGSVVHASASPHIVPVPWSIPEGVDPEEAFVAAIASCHMLFFLSIASHQGLGVAAYSDSAFGVMEKNAAGNLAITQVTLQPQVEFSSKTAIKGKDIMKIHHLAHDKCFLANSIHSEIILAPKL